MTIFDLLLILSFCLLGVTITKRWQYERGNTNLSYSKTYTGTLVTLLDGETVADAQTDQLATLTLDVSAVKAFYLVSDQAAPQQIQLR